MKVARPSSLVRHVMMDVIVCYLSYKGKRAANSRFEDLGITRKTKKVRVRFWSTKTLLSPSGTPVDVFTYC